MKYKIIIAAIITMTCFMFIIMNINKTIYFQDVKSSWWYSKLKTDYILTVNSKELHDKWIVVTTVNQPTEDIAKLAKISGWNLVVVGDEKTPKNWSYPGTTYLGVDTQLSLGYETVKNIPFNSYTRKTIGYLYAIHHGAKYIYDTDDDNHPTNGRIDFLLEPTTTGLIYEDRTANVVNPYAHFGQPSIWPRGYPLELINSPTNNTYKLCSFSAPTIQQGLVNTDPDVDAIFRLTRKENPSKSFNITFDSRAPPLVLPRGVFAPFNSQNTLFTYDAFWAMFLPTTVNFRVTDIWRGYWAQRLMWLLGQKLAFFPPNAIQIRNAHSYLKDFEDETQVYTETNRLIKFLKNWECFAKSTFFDCVRQLTKDMATEGFWEDKDVILIETWLSDLKKIGYEEPSLVFEEDHMLGCDNDTAPDVRTVFFSPVSQNELSKTSDVRNIQDFCGEFLNTNATNLSKLAKSSQHVYDNILLVIVFNFPYHNSIPLLDTLYVTHFSNIAYCSQAKNFEELQSKISDTSFPWTKRNITFINIETQSGFYGYECAIRAMEMRYNVDGYLILGDDVLFNVWNFKKVNMTNSAYETDSHSTLNRYKLPNETGWNWWGTNMGYVPTNQLLTKLDKLLETGNAVDKNLLQTYFHNRNIKNLNDSVSICLSDIYYIPNFKTDLFLELMKIFFEHRIFLEIAVPTVIDGLDDNKPGVLLGPSIWGGARDDWDTYYNPNNLILHPVKLSNVLNKSKERERYCKKYIEKLLSNW